MEIKLIIIFRLGTRLPAGVRSITFYEGRAKQLCCDLSSESVVGGKRRYTYCSHGMEKQLLAAIEAGDFDGVKRIVGDENLIHRINTITGSYRMTPLHYVCM